MKRNVAYRAVNAIADILPALTARCATESKSLTTRRGVHFLVRAGLMAGLLGCGVFRGVRQPPVRVHVGGTETCAIDAQGSAQCWGLRTTERGPILVETPEALRNLDPGVFQSCGLSRRGTTLCTWAMANPAARAEDFSGGCAGLVCLTPLMSAAPARYSMLSNGHYHACVLDSAGAAHCWGRNGMGQLGLGWRAADSTGSGGARVRVPTRIAGDLRFRTISSGELYTCALTPDGRAYCWGHGQAGELGRDTVMTYCRGEVPQINATCSVDRPVEVETSVRFTQISAGMRLTCAVSVDAAAYCWGNNYRCALGQCGMPNSSVPTRLPIPGKVVQVDAGYWFACAVNAEHRAFCWGHNASGQLGSLATDAEGRCVHGGRCTGIPTEVSGGHRWRSVSAGEQHACGVTLDGDVYCWGSREAGRLGLEAGDEICRNESETWKDVPCSSTPVRIAERPRP